jgi:CheY-like chemotaxis protein
MGEKMGGEMSSVTCKRILYVDDEKSLVMLGADLLEDYGYHVTCAYNGDEALALLDQKSEAFDVVVTDESMPGMTGIQLSQELYQRAPDIPVILCSGHMLTMQEEGMAQTNIKAVLAKTDVCTKLPALLAELF